MTNDDIYKLVNFITRKDAKGTPETINNFSRALQQANSNHFKDEYQIYQANQNVNDSMSPFEVRQAVSGLTTTTTTITLPTDYAHFIGMYWTDSDSLDRAFDLVTDEEWDMRCGATITIPSDKYPICKVVGDKIHFKPSASVITSGVLYGYLYNRHAVVTANFTPTDWIIPATSDYQTLSTTLLNTDVGGKLKEVGFDHWTSPNTGATNEVGFTSIGNGIRFGGVFSALTESAPIWDSGQFDASNGYYWIATYNLTSFNRSVVPERTGVAVRLLYTGAGVPTSLTDYDGNFYNVVKIGSQYWTVQNWACTKLNDGTPLTKVTDNTAWNSLNTEGYCAYNNDESNVFV